MKPDARYMVGMILNKRGKGNGEHAIRFKHCLVWHVTIELLFFMLLGVELFE